VAFYFVYFIPLLLFLPNILLRNNKICVVDPDIPITVDITRLMKLKNSQPFLEFLVVYFASGYYLP